MTDLIPDRGLIYVANGIFSWDSPCLDPEFSSKVITVQDYMNHITPYIIYNMEAQLWINEWNTWFFSEPPIHLSYIPPATRCTVSPAMTAVTLMGTYSASLTRILTKTQTKTPSTTLRLACTFSTLKLNIFGFHCYCTYVYFIYCVGCLLLENVSG